MNFRSFVVVLIIFLSGSKISHAQLEKANNYFDNFYYAKAIPLYAKAAKKEKTKIIATQKLADCYRILHDYKNAEMQYAKVIQNGSHLPIYHLYYGQMLFNNGHLNPAKEQFIKFTELVSEDKRSQNLMNSIIITRLWSVKQREYTITNLRDINTEGAEFCAVPYNKNLVFVSDRGIDLVNYAKNPADNRPYLALFEAEMGKGRDSAKVKKIHSLSNKINNEYHNGPATFVESGRQVFFTRVDRKVYAKNSGEINRPRIYFSTKTKEGWDHIRPLAYNNDAYSLAHPAISADGTLLIFSSDMPGGFGGKDLYACTLEGANWGKPVNLGPKINSTQDEVFPHLHKNGTLYFSSDGHIGYGGLDIYSARYVNNQWGEVRNLHEPINSTYDDFGISFLFKTANGYFSSNRPGGVGGDDVYAFDLIKKAPKITAISGKIYQNELDVAQNVEVKLIDEKGVEMARTRTDSTGTFKFEKLNPEDDYVVLLDADEIGFANKEITHFHGRLFYNEDMPASKAKLIIKNKDGVWVKEMETDPSGYFRFDFLNYDENSLDTLDDSDVAFVKRELHKYQQLTSDNIIPDNLDNSETVARLKKIFKYDALFADSIQLKRDTVGDTQFYVKNGFRYDKLSGDSISLEQLFADSQEFYIKKGFRFSRLNGDSISIDKLTEEDVNFSVYSYTLKARIFADAKLERLAAGVKITVKDGDGKVYAMPTTDAKGEIKVNFLPINKTYVIKVDQDNDIIQSNNNYSAFGRVLNVNNTKFPVKGKEISFANSEDKLYVDAITDAEGFFTIVGTTEKRIQFNLLATKQDSLDLLALGEEGLRKKKEEERIRLNKLGNTSDSINSLAANDAEFRRKKEEEIRLKKLNNSSDSLNSLNATDSELLRKKEEERIKLARLHNTSDSITKQDITDEEILRIFGNKTARELTFTTQIAAYKNAKNFKYQKLEPKFGKVKVLVLEDGISRFTVQSHATINSADSVRQLLIKAGVKDAFVTAIYKGKRYLLRDLIKLGIFTEEEAAYFNKVDGENNNRKPKDENLEVVKPLVVATLTDTNEKIEVTASGQTDKSGSTMAVNSAVNSVENNSTNTTGANSVNNSTAAKNTKENSATKSKSSKMVLPANMDKLVDEYGDVITEKVEYRVQVGAFKLNSDSYHYKRLLEVGTIDKKEYQDGIVRYTIGHCETLREADKIRRQVVKVGTTDAFVVVVFKGNRYTVYEAIRSGLVKK